MIYSGLVILAFLGLHFYDFWIPEIKYKYIEIQKSSTELVFFGTKNYMVIAFRGTQIHKIKDLVMDAKFKIEK